MRNFLVNFVLQVLLLEVVGVGVDQLLSVNLDELLYVDGVVLVDDLVSEFVVDLVVEKEVLEGLAGLDLLLLGLFFDLNVDEVPDLVVSAGVFIARLAHPGGSQG